MINHETGYHKEMETKVKMPQTKSIVLNWVNFWQNFLQQGSRAFSRHPNFLGHMPPCQAVASYKQNI